MSETLKLLLGMPIIIGIAVGVVVGMVSIIADMIRWPPKNERGCFSPPEEPEDQTPPHLRENE